VARPFGSVATNLIGHEIELRARCAFRPRPVISVNGLSEPLERQSKRYEEQADYLQTQASYGEVPRSFIQSPRLSVDSRCERVIRFRTSLGLVRDLV
jgi:hypothetical protein